MQSGNLERPPQPPHLWIHVNTISLEPKRDHSLFWFYEYRSYKAHFVKALRLYRMLIWLYRMLIGLNRMLIGLNQMLMLHRMLIGLHRMLYGLYRILIGLQRSKDHKPVLLFWKKKMSSNDLKIVTRNDQWNQGKCFLSYSWFSLRFVILVGVMTYILLLCGRLAVLNNRT